MLKRRDFMHPLAPFLHRCTYCKYDRDFKKSTAVWTNKPGGLRLKHCDREPCDYKREHGIHYACAPAGPSKQFHRSAGSAETYQMPKELLAELFAGIVVGADEEIAAPVAESRAFFEVREGDVDAAERPKAGNGVADMVLEYAAAETIVRAGEKAVVQVLVQVREGEL
eukprot:jgi/Tetstr1/423700/TSEL_014334.t1